MSPENPVPENSPTPAPDLRPMVENVKKSILSLSKFDRISFFAGIVYAIALFLPFYTSKINSYAAAYGIDVKSQSASLNDLGGVTFFVCLVVAIFAIVGPFSDKLLKGTKLPVPMSLIYFVGGIIGVALPALRYLTEDNKKYFDLSFGFFILLAAAAAIAYSGFARGGLTQLMQYLPKSAPQIKDETDSQK